MRKRIVSVLGLVGCALIFTFGFAQQHPQSVSAQAPGGTIAYVVGNDAGDEVWLTEPDGSHNHRIYSAGITDKSAFISSLSWRPDAGELIFTSNYERWCSWYEYDVYAIAPDGSAYRRVTNSPACAGLAALPQGGVVLDNHGSGYGYAAYIQGAPGPKFDNLGTISFDHVADLGNVPQPIVLFKGGARAMGGVVDVKAGQAVSGVTGVYTTFDDEMSAYNPVWKRDGSRITYAFGCAELRSITDHPQAGDYGQLLFNANGSSPCLMAWGPTAATANQFLYFSRVGGAGIYRTTEGGGVGTALIPMADLSKVFRIQYLPDASGFVYSMVTGGTSSDIFRYDFQSNTSTQLTDFHHEYARDLAVSPDGKYIVFERAPEELMAAFGGQSDLWIMGTDGSNPHLLVAGGRFPAWTGQTPYVPPPNTPPGPAGAFNLYLPLVKK